MPPEIDASWPFWMVVLAVVGPVVVTVLGTVIVAKINRQNRIQKEQTTQLQDVHSHVVNDHKGTNLRDDVDSIKSTLSSLGRQIQDLKLSYVNVGESLELRYNLQNDALANAMKQGRREIAQAIEVALEHTLEQHRIEREEAIDKALDQHILDCPLRQKEVGNG